MDQRFYASRRRDRDDPTEYGHTPYTVRDRLTGAWYGDGLTRQQADRDAADMNKRHDRDPDPRWIAHAMRVLRIRTDVLLDMAGELTR